MCIRDRQVGAEIFGVADESADIDIIEAMLKTLNLSKAKDITLSLGHVGIYRALLEEQGLEAADEQSLREYCYVSQRLIYKT